MCSSSINLINVSDLNFWVLLLNMIGLSYLYNIMSTCVSLHKQDCKLDLVNFGVKLKVMIVYEYAVNDLFLTISLGYANKAYTTR